MSRISVIIPTLNEEATLGEALSFLRESELIDQIIVVDGGSVDETRSIAEQFDVVMLQSESGGRAQQMNVGARAADGDLLLFLHADTHLPEKALRSMIRVINKHPESPGGGFLRFFDHPSWFLKMTCLFALWRCHFKGVFYGDQAIFVRAEAFEKVGGYDETMPYGEEVALCLKLQKAGKMRIVLSPISSSARRFAKRGVVRQTFIDKRLGRELIEEHR